MKDIIKTLIDLKIPIFIKNALVEVYSFERKKVKSTIYMEFLPCSSLSKLKMDTLT
jgi:hypothetical protein